MLSVYSVIKKPLITEKSSAESENLSKYHFIVDCIATKEDIRAAVEELFKVSVDSVNTMLYHGKPKRVRAHFTKRQSFKKAIVTLKEGSKIDFFEEMATEEN